MQLSSGDLRAHIRGIFDLLRLLCGDDLSTKGERQKDGGARESAFAEMMIA